MRRIYLTAILIVALSLSACASPLERAFMPASLADLDAVQAITADSFEEQRDAYVRAKQDGHEDPTMAAFDAGVDTSDQPEQGGSFTALLNMLLELLGYGSVGTMGAVILSKMRRRKEDQLPEPDPKTVRKPRTRAKK